MYKGSAVWNIKANTQEHKVDCCNGSLSLINGRKAKLQTCHKAINKQSIICMLVSQKVHGRHYTFCETSAEEDNGARRVTLKPCHRIAAPIMVRHTLYWTQCCDLNSSAFTLPKIYDIECHPCLVLVPHHCHQPCHQVISYGHIDCIFCRMRRVNAWRHMMIVMVRYSILTQGDCKG